MYTLSITSQICHTFDLTDVDMTSDDIQHTLATTVTQDTHLYAQLYLASSYMRHAALSPPLLVVLSPVVLPSLHVPTGLP